MKTKKLDKKKIIIAIVVILVIAIAVTSVILILKNSKKDNQTTRNGDLAVGDFESTIDMSDTSNSEIRDDGFKINTSEKLAKGIKFNDLLLKDIHIESSGDMASFSAQVDNNLGKDLEDSLIYLVFLKKDGTVIDKVETLFPDIPDGETGYITATCPNDIATSYDLQVEMKLD